MKRLRKWKHGSKKYIDRKGGNMYYFKIEGHAISASFRVPETHTFQQTLMLPPRTALIGLVGAAAGWGFKEALEFSKEQQIRFGIRGKHQSKANDLWKYKKIKEKETISAVLTREILMNIDVVIYIAAEKEHTAKELNEFFSRPRYTLTLGTSDDLLKIKRLSVVQKGKIIEAVDFSNTILAGDHSANYESNIDINKVPLLQEIKTPQVFLLPDDFSFKGYERRVISKKHYTFIDLPVKLRQPVKAIMDNDTVVALL